MSLLLLAAAVALPTAAGWTVVARLVRAPAAGAALGLGLALPLGLAMGSLFTYGWLVAGGQLGQAYAVADAIAFATVVAAARRRGDREPPGAPPWRTLDRAAWGLVLVALLVGAAAFVQRSSVHPHGQWDGWAIWNLRARFLFRGGAAWRDGLAPELAYSHPEYPLLLPAVVARLWAYGGESTVAPAVAAATFWLAPPLVLLGALGRRVGRLPAAIAALLLLATPEWNASGASQYADVPLAALVTAAAACLLLEADAAHGALRRVGLAGAFLGFGAWTKDEGVVLCLAFGAWALSPGAGQPLRRRAVALALGAAAPLLARAHFQAFVAPGLASVFTAGATGEAWARRLLDPARWADILAGVARGVPGAPFLPVAVLGAAALLGARWRRLPRSPALPALLAVVAFGLVYGVTPLDPSWHVARSAARVLLQPWPAFLLGIFSLVTPVGAPDVASR